MSTNEEKIKEIVVSMSAHEKAEMVVGKDFWHVRGTAGGELQEMMLTDGPHGLRKQAGAGDHLGIGDSEKAIAFPAGCASAASFDPAVSRKIGEELGKICQSENVGVILGPAMNIKRSPLCGRNF